LIESERKRITKLLSEEGCSQRKGQKKFVEVKKNSSGTD